MSGQSAGEWPTYDLIVLGDQVILGGRVEPVGIAIRNGRIAALLDVADALKPALAARTIDARGKVVLPGVIDAHVHQRTFNDTADTWESLTRGAALSDVTTVIPHIPQASGIGVGETLDDRPPRTPVRHAPATT